jgi:hypothetical protein
MASKEDKYNRFMAISAGAGVGAMSGNYLGEKIGNYYNKLREGKDNRDLDKIDNKYRSKVSKEEEELHYKNAKKAERLSKLPFDKERDLKIQGIMDKVYPISKEIEKQQLAFKKVRDRKKKRLAVAKIISGTLGAGLGAYGMGKVSKNYLEKK